MASGFIILRDGRCLSLRHKVYDAVLRSIAATIDDSNLLRSWLTTQIPTEDDIDLGYAFVRANDGEHVSRELDSRALTEPNRNLFEHAALHAEPIAAEYAPIEDVTFALNRFREMLRLVEEGRPSLTLSDWTIEAPPCEKRIGPGWNNSA